MIGIIIALIFLGVIMIITEFILPGAVIGILGAIALVAAIVLAFFEFGATAGIVVALAVVIVLRVSIGVWMHYFDKMPFFRKLTLRNSVTGSADGNQYHKFLNQTGTAQTDLRPAGKAQIGGVHLDVVAESGLIEEGAKIEVVLVEGNRIAVRESEVIDRDTFDSSG